MSSIDTNWATLLAGNDRRGGTTAARRTPPGGLAWKVALPDDVRSSPVLADGVLYATCRDGRLYAFDPSTVKATQCGLGATAMFVTSSLVVVSITDTLSVSWLGT